MLLKEYVQPEEKFGIERLQEQMGDTRMPNGVKAFLLVAVAIAGIGLYKYFTAPVSDGSVASAPPVAANANTAQIMPAAVTDQMLKGLPKVTPIVIKTPEFKPFTAEQMSNMRKAACDSGAKNMGPC